MVAGSYVNTWMDYGSGDALLGELRDHDPP